MASGTIIFNKSSLNSSGPYLQGQITYSYSQSASNNTSTISCNSKHILKSSLNFSIFLS